MTNENGLIYFKAVSIETIDTFCQFTKVPFKYEKNDVTYFEHKTHNGIDHYSTWFRGACVHYEIEKQIYDRNKKNIMSYLKSIWVKRKQNNTKGLGELPELPLSALEVMLKHYPNGILEHLASLPIIENNRK